MDALPFAVSFASLVLAMAVALAVLRPHKQALSGGLQNTGNSCFQNAVVQALLSLKMPPPLSHTSHLLLSLKTDKNRRTLRPILDTLDTKLSVGDQHDSHEFLQIIVAALYPPTELNSLYSGLFEPGDLHVVSRASHVQFKWNLELARNFVVCRPQNRQLESFSCHAHDRLNAFEHESRPIDSTNRMSGTQSGNQILANINQLDCVKTGNQEPENTKQLSIVHKIPENTNQQLHCINNGNPSNINHFPMNYDEKEPRENSNQKNGSQLNLKQSPYIHENDQTQNINNLQLVNYNIQNIPQNINHASSIPAASELNLGFSTMNAAIEISNVKITESKAEICAQEVEELRFAFDQPCSDLPVGGSQVHFAIGNSDKSYIDRPVIERDGTRKRRAETFIDQIHKKAFKMQPLKPTRINQRSPFLGLKSSSLKCPNRLCKVIQSQTLSTFTCISTPPLSSRESSVSTMINYYFSKEFIDDYKCACGSIGVNQTTTAVHFPDLLVLHVQRSVFTEFGAIKNKAQVNVDKIIYIDTSTTTGFPSRTSQFAYLDIESVNARIVQSSLGIGTSLPVKYVLKSVVLHSGTHEYGHYECIRLVDGQWVRFSDEIVYSCADPSSSDFREGGNVYMCFYEREGCIYCD